MAATVDQLIGKINPKLYAENGAELLKKYGSWDKIPAEEVVPKPASEHKLTYDSSADQLEPIYFYILDMMNDRAMKPEKLVDNFSSSPGSGHFGEMGQRMSVMQQQGVKILGDINNVLRSVLNIIYDLKDFRTRLQVYKDSKDKDPARAEAARLSLKQIWLDKVDINKGVQGNSSIKAMALSQAGFVTLLDAFLAVKDEKEVAKMDLNERVKRIVEQRIQEFNVWVIQSEMELNKRYEIEKTYLKSQVNSLKIYAQWAKPYLVAAQQLQMTDMSKNPSLVKAFNTILLQLTLIGSNKVDVADEVIANNFPTELKGMKIKRDYFACTLIDFSFRGIPQRASATQSHYVFGGLSEVTFRAYALNADEKKALSKEVETSLVSDVLKLIEGATTESLANLKDEIEYYLEEKPKEEKKEEKSSSSGGKGFGGVIADLFYPFAAMSGRYDKEGSADTFSDKKSGDKKKEDKSIRSDDYIEKTFLRKFAEDKAKTTTFDLFEIYKKTHGMASFPLNMNKNDLS
ncbi:Uncharacterised protein [uncultured archaeon]|nr:Uncharacterised protein [uncultured archaeon]